MTDEKDLDSEIFIDKDGRKYRKEIVTFGELKEDDYVLGRNSSPTQVSAAYEAHMPESMYKLTTEDGNIVKASGNHLWYVIAQFDREIYHPRLKEGKRLSRSLTTEAIKMLEDAATSDSVEVAIREMADSLSLKSSSTDNTLTYAIVRVAEGIGHVAEKNFYVDYLDSSDEEPIFDANVYMYDSKIFAQQLLSLFGIKKYRKKWPLIVGKVMTTEAMLSYDLEELTIPALAKK